MFYSWLQTPNEFQYINPYDKSTDPTEIIVGIDLGTTQSFTAYYYDKSVYILQTREGIDTTESFVYYDNTYTTTVGLLGKNKAISYKAENGIYGKLLSYFKFKFDIVIKHFILDFKRLMGRSYDDKNVKQNLQFLTYTIKNQSNVPLIVYQHGKQFLAKTATEICSILLTKLKYDIRSRLQMRTMNKIKVVITVPAYFNIKQREAILKAAEAAGLKVLKLLNEPTAAALFYFSENQNEKDGHFLVFDLGGGTFDVAIVKKTDGNIETIAVSGDNFLGGRDFDNLILSYVIDVIRQQYYFDARKLTNMFLQLKIKCEQAKIELSFTQHSTITMKRLWPLFELKLSRNHFEQMANSMFIKTLDIVKMCIEDSGLSKNDIKRVILSGGSTKIPKIKQLLSEYFGVNKLYNFEQPDKCVAKGAAIQAAMLSKHAGQNISMASISDVTPLSIGIHIVPNIMDIIIKRNTKIPCSTTASYFTANNDETQYLFKIFEGERTDSRLNRCIGILQLNNITPNLPFRNEIKITMSINDNGTLTISVKEQLKQNAKHLSILYIRGQISDAEVKNTLKDAEDNKEQDQIYLNFAASKRDLLHYCQSIMYNIKSQNQMKNMEKMYEYCNKVYHQAFDLESHDLPKFMALYNKTKSESQKVVALLNFELLPPQL